MPVPLIRHTTTDAGAIAEAQLQAPISGRAIREAAGLSLWDVARDVGVTAAAVAKWETGAARPTGARAVAYVALLRELVGLFNT